MSKAQVIIEIDNVKGRAEYVKDLIQDTFLTSGVNFDWCFVDPKPEVPADLAKDAVMVVDENNEDEYKAKIGKLVAQGYKIATTSCGWSEVYELTVYLAVMAKPEVLALSATKHELQLSVER